MLLWLTFSIVKLGKREAQNACHPITTCRGFTCGSSAIRIRLARVILGCGWEVSRTVRSSDARRRTLEFGLICSTAPVGSRIPKQPSRPFLRTKLKGLRLARFAPFAVPAALQTPYHSH